MNFRVDSINASQAQAALEGRLELSQEQLNYVEVCRVSFAESCNFRRTLIKLAENKIPSPTAFKENLAALEALTDYVNNHPLED